MSELATPVILGLAAGIVFILIFATYMQIKPIQFVPEKYVPTAEGQEIVTPAVLFKKEQYTLYDVKAFQNKVCGDYPKSLENMDTDDPRAYEQWLPHEVDFTYLEPKYHFVEMGCFMWPTGMISAQFYVDNDGNIIELEENETTFSIETTEQAFEYFEFFYHGRSSGTSIIETNEEIQDVQDHCEQLQSFPINATRITRSSNAFIVEAIVSDFNTGYVNYEKWSITSDGISSNRLEIIPLANCHAVI